MIGDLNLVLVYTKDHVYVYENEELTDICIRKYFNKYDILDYLLGKRLYSYKIMTTSASKMSGVDSLMDALKKYKIKEL